jgi:hypothetical protein
MDLQELGCGGMDWIELAEDGDRGRALHGCEHKFRDYTSIKQRNLCSKTFSIQHPTTSFRYSTPARVE